MSNCTIKWNTKSLYLANSIRMVHSISAFGFLMQQKCLVKLNSAGRQKWEASRNLHACCIVAPNLLVLIFWDAQLIASRSHTEILCVVIFMVTRSSDDQASWQLNIYPWKHPGLCIATTVSCYLMKCCSQGGMHDIIHGLNSLDGCLNLNTSHFSLV